MPDVTPVSVNVSANPTLDWPSKVFATATTSSLKEIFLGVVNFSASSAVPWNAPLKVSE